MAFVNPRPRFALLFDPEPHTYLYEGRFYDSYSSIVKSEGFGYQGNGGPWTSRGRFLHDVNTAIIDGDLDDDAIPEEYRGYVMALRKFHDEVRLAIEACELPLVNPEMGYACTPDMVAVRSAQRAPWDLKSGDITDVGLQLAAQARAWDINFPDRPCGPFGYCLSIDAGGMYRVYRYNLATEWLDFAAIARVRQRRLRGTTNGNGSRG